MIPIVTPITITRNVLTNATASETRAPYSVRENTSRPTPSVPKNVFVEKFGPEAEPNESRNFVDCSFGGRTPRISMICLAKIAQKIRKTMKIERDERDLVVPDPAPEQLERGARRDLRRRLEFAGGDAAAGLLDEFGRARAHGRPCSR